MSGFLLTLHVIVSVLLVAVILLQPGAKGGGLGASFGGGGANSAFGAQGAAPFLAKFTYWLAAGFMITSLVIEVIIVKENKFQVNLAPKAGTAKPATAPPAAPAPAPTAPQAPAQK